MTTQKGIFQKALDAIVEGRSRQAQRYVDHYLASRRIGTGKQD